jgi:hypothetical protein
MPTASVVAGGLWDSFGPSATFLAGAAFAVVALLGFLLIRRPRATSASRKPGERP